MKANEEEDGGIGKVDGHGQDGRRCVAECLFHVTTAPSMGLGGGGGPSQRSDVVIFSQRRPPEVQRPSLQSVEEFASGDFDGMFV